MQDPLNISVDLGGVESSLPLLPEGDYPVQIVESVIEPNKDKTGLNWKLKLCTTAPAVAQDGREVGVNFPLFLQHALQPAADAKDPQGFKRMLCATIDAICGTNKDNRPAFNHEFAKSLEGRNVIASVKIDNYMDTLSNKVKRIKPVT